MSQLSVDVADTFIDSDRRSGPRVPLFAPVKIGPAGSVPTAEVSAADISSGGLFIDADRPVRVGAKFSVQVELPDGEAIYVPEAEVLYNRERRSGSGFGASFVLFESEARRLLEEAVKEAQLKSFVCPPMMSREDLSSVPTTLPSPHEHVPPERQGVRLDSSIDRKLAELNPGPLELTEIPSPEPLDVEISGRPEARAAWFEVPRKVVVTAAVGVMLTVAGIVGLALGGDATAEAVAPGAHRTEGNVSASTHRMLMGDADADAIDEAAPVAPRHTDSAKKRALPPLVPLAEFDKPAKEATEVAPAKKASKTKSKSNTKSKSKVKASSNPVAEEAKVEMKGGLRLTIPVQSSVEVRKTSVYKNPDRFVIDVVGQADTPRLPMAKGKIQRVRYGRHADFSRFVVDVNGTLEIGRAERVGDKLQITLVIR